MRADLCFGHLTLGFILPPFNPTVDERLSLSPKLTSGPYQSRRKGLAWNHERGLESAPEAHLSYTGLRPMKMNGQSSRIISILRLHPAQLLPHMQLIPILDKTMHLAIPDLKNRRGTPPRLPPTRLDPGMRRATVTALGRVSQQHVRVLGPGLVELNDV